MPHLTFAELLDRQVPVSVSEAAALALAVARELDAERAVGAAARLPEDGCILLNSTGQVSLLTTEGMPAVDDESAGLARLLRRLLRLESREGDNGTVHPAVPGGLLILLARNLGEIDLPRMSAVQFRVALERFATEDTTPLAAVFWRAAARLTPGASPRVNRRRTHMPRVREERRTHGPSRAQLRHAVRDLERQLFEVQRARTLQQSVVPRTPKDARYRWMPEASTVTVSGAAILLVAALAVTTAIGGVRDARTPESAATPFSGVGAQVSDTLGDRDLLPAAVSNERGDAGSQRSTRLDASRVSRVRTTTTSTSARTTRRESRPASAHPKPRAVSFPGGARPFPFAPAG